MDTNFRFTITDGHRLPPWQSPMDTNFRLDNHRWTQTSVLTISDGHPLPSWPLQMDTSFRFTIIDGHKLPSWQSPMNTSFRLDNHRWTQTSVLTIPDGHNLSSWPLQMDTSFRFTITDGHKLPPWQSQMDKNFRLDNHRWAQTSVLTITDGHKLPSWQSQMDTIFRFTITDGHKLPLWQSQMDTNFGLDNHRWTQTTSWQSQMSDAGVLLKITYRKFFGVASYPSRAPTFTPGFFSVVHIDHLFNLCVVVFCVFTFWVPCCDISVYIQCSVRLYLQLFVGGFMFCHIICICLPMVILCCVFVLFFFIWCTLCSHIFSVVHFWSPLRNCLTFVFIFGPFFPNRDRFYFCVSQLSDRKS